MNFSKTVVLILHRTILIVLKVLSREQLCWFFLHVLPLKEPCLQFFSGRGGFPHPLSMVQIFFFYPSGSGNQSRDLLVTSWRLYPRGHCCPPCETTSTCCLGSSSDLDHWASVSMASGWSVLMWTRWSQMALWFSEFSCVRVRNRGQDSKQEKQLKYLQLYVQKYG